MRTAIVCVLLAACGSSSKSSSSPATGAAGGSGDGDDRKELAATGDDVVTGRLPAGCMRMRTTHVYRCSGVPPAEGEPNSTPTTVCDECLTSADCTAQPGGACEQRGDQMCSGPRRAVCLYPDPACGNKICPERVTPPPPSTPP